MFNGLFIYSGTEIANVARTRAYLRHAVPNLGLKGDDCEGLAAALGDLPYTSPMADEAPWFSPYKTESQDFYGIIPTSVTGFEDSTYSTPVVQNTSHGGTFGSGRRATKELRIKGVAFASSEKGMDHGLAWLRDVLTGQPCDDGDCTGSTLCYLTDCPEECDYTDAPTTVLSETYSQMPLADIAAYTDEWSSNGTGAAYTSPVGPSIRWTLTSGPTLTVTRTMYDLVPGATYRVSVGAYGASPRSAVRITVPDAVGGLTAGVVPTTGVLGDPAGGGVGVFSFRASFDTHRLVLEAEANIVLTRVDVQMTSQDAVVMTTQPDSSAQEAFPWSASWALAAANMIVVDHAATWLFRSPTGTVAVAAGDLAVQRRLTGLTAGTTYRLTVAATSTRFDNTALGVRLSVAGVSGFTTGGADTLATTVKGGWLQYEFVAPAATVLVSVANRDAFTLTTSGAKVGVDYLRVEEVNPVVTLPDHVDPLRRFYQKVTLLDPPRVTDKYPPHWAVMRDVEWTMTAAEPQPVGVEVPVSTTLGPALLVTPEILCSNGAAVRINKTLNPAMATVNGWAQVGTSITWATAVDATSPTGTPVGQLASTAATTADKQLVFGPYPAEGGIPQAFSFAWNSNYIGMQLTITAEAYYSPPNSYLLTSQTVATDTTSAVDDWGTAADRVGFVWTPPNLTDTVIFRLNFHAPAWPIGRRVRLDGVLWEDSAVVSTWFSGASPDSAWTGAVNGSTSVYAKSSIAAILDPDCPPPPDAPQPPPILNDCLDTPVQWLRHVIEVPAQFTQASSRVVPSVTLTTDSTDARGVRVRVYANPFSRDIGELDPCSYCGEFLLSYMPANSALTVDASVREVYVVQGGQQIPAKNLLYGSDGGPMVWPEMDCGIPYTVTVDLDAVTSPLVNATLSLIPVF